MVFSIEHVSELHRIPNNSLCVNWSAYIFVKKERKNESQRNTEHDKIETVAGSD
jgi:hypothetical protein